MTPNESGQFPDDPNASSVQLLLEEAAHAMAMENIRVDADFQKFTRQMNAPGADRRAVLREFWDAHPDYAPRVLSWSDPETVTLHLGPMTQGQRGEVISRFETDRDGDDPPA